MNILELFAGEGGERRRARIEARGHTFVTEDIDPRFGCTRTRDAMTLTHKDVEGFDFVWASLPCECYSVASIGHHWTGGHRAYIPKTEAARQSLGLAEHVVGLLRNLPAWRIENPRGVLRKLPVMAGLPRETITYCRYGDTRMKPTDLWGVTPGWIPRTMCHNGHPDHERAPRGARTGTQGIKGAAARAIVPWPVWEEMLIALETSRMEKAA